MTAPLAQDIRNANAAAERILGELFTRSFAYTIEQKDGRWTLRVECATDGGWQVTTLPVNPSEMAASLRDAKVRARLSEAWRPHLQECAARSAASS